MVPGMKQLPYHTRLAQLGLWTLEERQHRADLPEVFCMYRGLSLTPFCRFFTLSSVTNTRGHWAKVLKNHCSLDLRRFFFSERVRGTANHSMWLTLQASMRSRMVSILWEEIRWASSWADWSVWPYGLTCFWGISGTGAVAPGKLPSKLYRWLCIQVILYTVYSVRFSGRPRRQTDISEFMTALSTSINEK